MALTILSVVVLLALVLADDSTPRTRASSPVATGDASSSPAAADTTPAETFRATDRAVLGIGSTGDDVLALQERLAVLGFDSGPIDGQFGAATAQAIRQFQSDRGLAADGVVGPQTWAALAEPR